MTKVFRKAKMLERLKKEGRMSEVTEKDLEVMVLLDGKSGSDYNWQSFVNGKDLVWIDADDEMRAAGFKDGAYVALEDCD